MTQYTNKRDLNARLRMNQALLQRLEGHTLAQIADACGYGSRSSAHKAIKRAMAELPREHAAELRALEIARLDALLLAWWPRALLDIDAAHLMLRLSERRARLCGLDLEPNTPDVQVVVREVPANFLGNLLNEPQDGASNGHVPITTQGV